MTTAVSDNLTRAEAQTRSAFLSDVAYDIALVLDKPAGDATFRSVTTVTFSAKEAGATFIDLDADSVESIELNGAGVPVAAFSDSRIQLTSVVAGPNSLRVVAQCAYQHTGVGLHRVVDPADGLSYVYTHFEPFDAHKVFACFDQPDIKAPVTVHVTAPQDWAIVSNNTLEREEGTGGAKTRHFSPTPRISTYLVAVVGGPYYSVHDTHNGTPMGIYCRRSLAAHLDPDEIFDITRRGLDFFAEYFDCAYPFAKYDQLFVPEFNMGAMENPGCITFNDNYLFRSKVTEATRARRANTILHEMAHMWFGDLVTMRWWDDLWLNESFATYMAHLCSFRATRFTDAWVDFAVAMKTWALRQDQLPSTHPIAADMVDTHSVKLNFDGITYAKGASVLRQLVAWVGDEAFRDGLRAFFVAHAWDNATLADFLKALEKSSGRQLAEWSQEWLETAGVSQLHADFETKDGKYSAFGIVQSATPGHPTLRSHRLGIGLYDDVNGHMVLRRRVDIDVTGADTPVAELVGETAAPLVVVNDGDLTFAKIRLDAQSIRSLVEAPFGIDDPLTRAVCGGALWDMTRDAEMATRDYVAIVARQAPLEDVATLERLLMQALLAIDMYGAPGNRPAARRLLNAAATAAFAAAPEGGDTQLVWARTLIALADTDGDLDRIAGWLDHEVVDGLRIDTDIRWAVLTRLAATGRATPANIDAEMERDPSDIGQRRAATALAARPLAEAKSAAWKRITSPGDAPLQMLNALMAGFSQPDQEALLRPYVRTYFEMVSGIWSTRSSEEAESITGGLFPRYIVSDDVVSGVDALLADEQLSSMPRRILSESRDAVLRAQRARACDEAAG